MPARSPARAPRPRAPAAPASAPLAASGAGDREPRGTRRKRETRARLLDAALRLMAARGADSVAINEITEAADVGFGSFYNHFESKAAIYDALMASVFEGYADTLDLLVEAVTDPAEAVAICVRHVLLRARREPLWAQLLLRESHSESTLTRGMGQRLMRDIQRGVSSGRFEAPDLLMSFVAVGGTVLSAIVAQRALAPDSPHADLARPLGLSSADLPERVATVILTTLGLKQAEAHRIARRPPAGCAAIPDRQKHGAR